MERILARCLVLFLFFVANVQAAETFKLDPKHSYILWHVNHFGFSSPSGKWFAEGTLILDEHKPDNSKVDVIIPVADLSTGIPKFDEHLKSPDFLDTAKYPNATFVSSKVEATGKTAKIFGTLTLHGVSRPVILNAKLNQIGISPITNLKTAGFTATTTIKRSDFGIKNYLPGVGDDVKLDIEVEADLAG